MSRHLLTAIVLLPVITVPAPAQDAEVVKRGKRATALMVLSGERGYATAFCMDSAGLFLTSAASVAGLPPGQKLTLMLAAGDDDEKKVEAVVLRSDTEAGLALLRVEKAERLTALELGDGEGDGLVETTPLTVFGFPAQKQPKYPSVNVHVGRITSLRKTDKKLFAIQLDARIDAGCAGGPAVDARGRLVGMIRAGVPQNGPVSLIPVPVIEGFLTRPEVVFDPPAIPYVKRYEQAKFNLRVISYGKTQGKRTVEANLGFGAAERTIAVKPGEGDAWTYSAAPLEADKGPARVALSAAYPSGRIECTVEDRPFQLDKTTFRLREVREIVAGTQAKVVTREGAVAAGKLAGLGPVRGDFGGYTAEVDLSKATKIVIARDESSPPQVDCVIVVRHDGKVAARLKTVLRFEGHPLFGTPNDPLQPASPRLLGAKSVFPLPGAIDQLAVGGGGRFLILHLKRLDKLAIFDVSQAKVVHYMPAPAEDFLFQASAEKLVVIIPSKKVLERWSLRTLEKERSVPMPVSFAPARAALGSASSGPLLLWGPLYDTALVDLDTLKKVEVRDLRIPGNLDTHGLMIEASPDGSAFISWNRRQRGEDPAQFRLLRIRGDTAVLRTGLAEEAPAHASIADGPVFTCDGRVYTADLKPIAAKGLAGATLVPVGNSYVLAARWEGPTRKTRLAVHFMSDLAEAFTIGDVTELDGTVTDKTDPAAFTWEKRLHFVPSAQLLVTIPATNDRLVLRKLDVEKALKEAKTQYLYVSSLPPRQALKGSTFTYQIEVKSSGKVEFALDDGPRGMTLSKTGKLAWDIPADIAEREAAVIVSIVGDSGRKIFHAFTVRLIAPPASAAP